MLNKTYSENLISKLPLGSLMENEDHEVIEFFDRGRAEGAEK